MFAESTFIMAIYIYMGFGGFFGHIVWLVGSEFHDHGSSCHPVHCKADS